mgnify:CR=1 FL=1
MDDIAATKNFLNECQFMTLSVIAEDGQSWGVPVHIALQKGIVFEWESSMEAVHSRAIEVNPRIAISMFRLTYGDQKEFGFYAQADAEEIEEIGRGRARYRATIVQAWINDEQHVKREISL